MATACCAGCSPRGRPQRAQRGACGNAASRGHPPPASRSRRHPPRPRSRDRCPDGGRQDRIRARRQERVRRSREPAREPRRQHRVERSRPICGGDRQRTPRRGPDDPQGPSRRSPDRQPRGRPAAGGRGRPQRPGARQAADPGRGGPDCNGPRFRHSTPSIRLVRPAPQRPSAARCRRAARCLRRHSLILAPALGRPRFPVFRRRRGAARMPTWSWSRCCLRPDPACTTRMIRVATRTGIDS